MNRTRDEEAARCLAACRRPHGTRIVITIRYPNGVVDVTRHRPAVRPDQYIRMYWSEGAQVTYTWE